MIIITARKPPRTSKSATSSTEELIGFSSDLFGLRRYRAATPHRLNTMPGSERRTKRDTDESEGDTDECVGVPVGQMLGLYMIAVVVGNAVGSKYVTDLS